MHVSQSNTSQSIQCFFADWREHTCWIEHDKVSSIRYAMLQPFKLKEKTCF